MSPAIRYAVGPRLLALALAVWRARDYSGSGDWLPSVGDSGYIAQAGSAAGSDSNDPTFLPGDPSWQYDFDDFHRIAKAVTATTDKWTWGFRLRPLDGMDRFQLRPLGDLKANLAGEYAIELPDGAQIQVPSTELPNWDANGFAVAIPLVRNWSDNAVARTVFVASAPNGDYMNVFWDTGRRLRATIRIDGVAYQTTHMTADTLGAGFRWVFLRWDGTTLRAYADRNQDGVLESISVTPGAGVVHTGGQVWSLTLGNLDGAASLQVLNDPSEQGILDRFNAGAGQAIATWLGSYGDRLVLSAGGNSNGTSTEYRRFPGTTYLHNTQASGSDRLDVPGFTPSTNVRVIFTYLDDTTAIDTLSVNASGVLVLSGAGGTFAQKKIKTIEVQPDGGGATLELLHFTGLHEGRTSGVGDFGRTWTLIGQIFVRLDVEGDATAGVQKIANPSFETFTETGQYDFITTDNGISLGDFQALDGEDAFTMLHEFRADAFTTNPHLFDRWLNTDNDRLLRLYIDTAGNFQFSVATDATGGIANARSTTGIAAGTKYLLGLRYLGSGATNADRLQAVLWTRDDAAGKYGSPVTLAFTFTGGAIPASLITLLSTRITRVYGSGQGFPFDGKADTFALRIGAALDLTALDPYNLDPAAWDILYTLDGNANNSGTGGAAYNGTVAGTATQVADGRKPTGWDTGERGPGETDRATGADQKAGGSYGLRLRDLSGGWSFHRALVTKPNLATGEWFFVRAKGRGGSGSVGSFNFVGPGIIASLPIPIQGTMATFSRAWRPTGPGNTFVDISAQSGGDVWADDVALYQLAAVTPSVATPALPSRTVWSETAEGAPYPWRGLFLAEDEGLEYRSRSADGTSQATAGGDTSVSVGGDEHTVIVTSDGAEIRVYVDGSLEATAGAAGGDFSGLTATFLGALVTDFRSRGLDGERIAAAAAFGFGMDAQEAALLHADLELL